jgi:DNA-binding response OmpR family regulator
MQRILVVDDEPGIRSILSKALSRSGYDVVTAEDGQQAIDLLNGPQVLSLMILDWRMPRVSGLSVVRELIRQKRRLPILILSGAIDTDCEAETLAAVDCSPADVHRKPIQLHAFLEAIKRRLAEARPAVALADGPKP